MVNLLLSLVIAFSGQVKTADWQWNSIGPDGGTVLYVAPNSDGSSLLAVTPSSVWKYDGTSWNIVLDHVSGGPIYNTGQDSFCFISTYYDSTIVYVSTDGGNTWTRKHSFIFGISGYSNVNGRYIYLATDNYIFVSSDGGNTWTTYTPPYPVYIGADVLITYSPSHPAAPYLLAYYDSSGYRIARFYKSTNGGASWNEISYSPSLFGATSLAIDPDDTNRLAVDVGIVGGDKQTYPGIYISNDGGQSWSFLLTSLASGIIMASDMIFHNGNLYVASQITSGIYKGYEVSGVWFFSKIDSLKILNDLASAGGTLYCGYSGGVLESSNWQSFNDITNGLKAVGVPFEDGQFGTSHSHVVNNTLYLIDNSGFYVEHNGPIFSNVVYITRDGGNTWEKKFVTDLLVPIGVQTPINSDSIVYLSGIGYEFDSTGNFRLHYIYRSNDAGQLFIPTDPGISLDSLTGIYDVEWISPSDPNRILAKFASFDKKNLKVLSSKIVNGLLLSTDGGQNFSAILPNIIPLRMTGGDTIALSCFENWSPVIEISFDGGISWSTSVIPITGTYYATDLLLHANKLYCSCNDLSSNNIYVSYYDFSSGILDTIFVVPAGPNVVDMRLAYGNHKVFTDVVVSDSTGQNYSSIIYSVYHDTLTVDTPNMFFTAIDTLGSQIIGFTKSNSVYGSSEGYVGVNENPRGPTTSIVHVAYTAKGLEFSVKLQEEYSLSIFDITGRKIFGGKFETHTLTLNGVLKPGVYFYKVESGNYKTSGKFVIFR